MSPSTQNLKYIGPSSCVGAAGFKYQSAIYSTSGDLTIQFQDGSTYTYHSVPQEVWFGLQSASSKGVYFNRQIRNVYSWS